MQKETEWATIGRIVAPFGIRGELKALSLSDIPDRFVQLDSIYLAPAYTSYAIEKVRPYKGDMVLLKLGGVDDANKAETLRQRDICIPLSDLAKLPPDSYYQHDILGLHVYQINGREVGVITDIMLTGGNDVYIVKADSGKEFLIPAIKAIIKQIDLIRQVMYIEPIAGLLDDQAVIGDEEDHSDSEE